MNELEYQSPNKKRKGIGLLPWLSLTTSIGACWMTFCSPSKMFEGHNAISIWILFASLASSMIAAISGIVVSIIKRRSLIAFCIVALAICITLFLFAITVLGAAAIYFSHGPG